MENACLEIKLKDDKNKWNEILFSKKNLKNSAQNLAICLEKYFDTLRKFKKFYKLQKKF